MIKHLVPITALLAGVALLLLGSGLLGTLLAVRGSAEGFSDVFLGLIGSGYFVGFLAGSFIAPPLIRRVGHVRAFAFFAAATAAATLLYGLLVTPSAWIALRVLTGTALVALYTIIESWLNSQAPRQHRGRIFAIYMMVNLGALAAAQQLLRIDSSTSFTLFAVSSLLVCLAVMPVSATRLPQPQASKGAPFSLRLLMRAAPVAVAGGLLSGLAMGAFWGMGAVYAGRIGLADNGVALFMSAAILGGAVLQWPLGAFSDSRDRRLALAVVALAAALAAGGLAASSFAGRWAVAAVALYGGLAFAVYPIAVALLVDHLPQEELLTGSSGLLLIHGIGAAIGPLLAGLAMDRIGPQALPLHFAVMQLLLAAIAFASVRRSEPEISEPGHFMPMLRTSATVLEMIPANEQTTQAEAATAH
ncbi:MAG: MFS transporter [Rhodoferax sp.]|nr:MFS transporter [Rhodoferax sp.]